MVLLMEMFHLLIIFRIIECVIGVSVICTRMLAEMGTRMSMKLVYITVDLRHIFVAPVAACGMTYHILSTTQTYI